MIDYKDIDNYGFGKDIQDRPVQSGFTLIELLIVVAVLTIIATVAVPSYKQYIVRNAESVVVAKMKRLEIDLEAWRATALTFKGFEPKKIANDGTVSYGYDESGMIIYVPAGSDSSNYSYKVFLDDGIADGTSLSGKNELTNVTIGSSWRIFAEPNENLGYTASKYLLKSDGTECRCRKSYGDNACLVESFTKNADCTETGVETWQ